jgi:RimJ/RimL family protein N-acetyltransferase
MREARDELIAGRCRVDGYGDAVAVELRTDRLLMRAWADADRAPFAALNADSEVMEHFPAVLSRAESDHLVDLVQEELTRRGWGLWAVELLEGGTFIGFVGLNDVPFEADFTPAVEVGWRLGRAHWGHGYATEAAGAALDYGFGPLRLDRIVSFTSTSNLRSQVVMQRIGMMPVGEFDHPRIAEGHPLRHHVLYAIDRPEHR